MKSKLFGCLSATVLGAAIAFATPAMAQHASGGGMHFGGGGGMSGGGMHFGGGGFRGGMVTGRSVFVPGGNRFVGAPFAGRHAFVNSGMPGGRMFTGRSVFVPGGNRFVGAPFAGRHAFFNGGRFDRREDRFEGLREGRFDRFEDRFGDRRFFFNRNFAFFGAPFAFGVPFAYDYAAYGNGCWRRVWTPYGWRWSNICNNYGGYNYGY